MGDMTTHHASSSYNTQTYQTISNNFTNPISHFRNFSNPRNLFRLPRSSHDQNTPHYKMCDYLSPKSGLALLASLTDDLTKPLKSNNIVFGHQIMKINLSPISKTFLVRRTNMVPPPLISYGVEAPSNFKGNLVMKPSLLPLPTRPKGSLTPTNVTSHPAFPKMPPCKFLDFLDQERHHQVTYFPSSWSPYPFDKYFLRVCYTCKTKLREGEDIYIYRGDSSFCSEECRFKKMWADLIKEAANKPPKKSQTSSKNGVIFFLGNSPL